MMPNLGLLQFVIEFERALCARLHQLNERNPTTVNFSSQKRNGAGAVTKICRVTSYQMASENLFKLCAGSL